MHVRIARLLTTLSLLSTFFCSQTSLAACTQSNGRGFSLKDDIAVNHASGLTWKRCLVGMTWDNKTNRCEGRPGGLSYPEALIAARKAGAGWRIPTGKELGALREHACHGPKIDSKVFPNIALADFGEGANVWTSTPALPQTFYFVDFTDGDIDFHSEGFSQAVLLVRSMKTEAR